MKGSRRPPFFSKPSAGPGQQTRADRPSSRPPHPQRPARGGAGATSHAGPTSHRGPRKDRAAGSSLDAELAVYGRHAVEATLRFQRDRARTLHHGAGRDVVPIVELAGTLGVSTQLCEPDTLDALAGKGAAHQGLVLACGPFPYVDIEDFDAAPSLSLVLDGLEDPRNLGAAARAAYALGADLVVVPRDRACAVTASALKASAGALARIPVAQVQNLSRALQQLKDKGAWLVGAEADASMPPWQVDLKSQIVLVVGGEDRGLRRLTREACDHVVSIPMPAPDMSLNAADAATVLLYEALRQRRGG